MRADAVAVCVTDGLNAIVLGTNGSSPGTVFPLVAPSLEQGPWLSTWFSGLSDAYS